ncbi:serine/threonine protein kinase, partial [Streptomyces sp. SID9727]|nr:serine/threonine protein kinase [Streptomyces sp. SID9727]
PAYPGGGAPPQPHATQPTPAPKKRRGRVAAIAVAAVLLFALAGGGTAYFLLKDNKSDDKGNTTAQDKNPPAPKVSAKPSAEPTESGDDGASDETNPMPTATSSPTPEDFAGINLTRGYHLTFGDSDVRPQDGTDGGYDLTYESGYLDAESEGGRLTLLDPGQAGSLDVCRSETRFADTIPLEQLSKGRQVCVTTGTGHMALVTYQGHSPEDSPSDYVTLDVTVWRNAAR